MDNPTGSRASGASDDEPLVPDDFDEDFFNNLVDKVPDITKALRQKDTQDNADNVLRLLICCKRFKADLEMEQMHSQELRNEIVRLNGCLEDASKISKLDQGTIGELRGVIEGAWRQKDAAQTREQTAKEEVRLLRTKVDELEETVRNLKDKRADLRCKQEESKEILALKSEISDSNKRMQIQKNYTKDLEVQIQMLEEKNKQLAKLLDEHSTEAYNNKKRMDALQKDFSSLKSEELEHVERFGKIKKQNEQLIKLKVRQNLQILSLKSNIEHLNTQNITNCNKLAKLTIDLEYVTKERDRFKRDLLQSAGLVKLREDDILRLRQENSKLVKSQDLTTRKFTSLEESRRVAEEENLRLKTQINMFEKEVESLRRIVQQCEKINYNIIKERDVLRRDLIVEHKTAEESNELFQESQHEIKSLKETIHMMDLKYKKLMDELKKTQKEKSKKLDEIQIQLDKVDTIKNEMQIKNNYEIELKRIISDLDAKCHKLQTQHDALLNEKNALQRVLQTTEEEKTKLQQQLHNQQHEIQSFKNKLITKDADIGKFQLQIDKMEKERRYLKSNLRKAQLGFQHTKAEFLEKKSEIDRYTKGQQEDEQKLSRMKKELDNVINEKNSICAALTKRNEEYTQLKDKLENLQAAYIQTDKQYTQSQDDLRLMRIEIKNLRTERLVLRKDRENAADLRQELLQIHRLLNQERIKARALQEEMMTPMNIHRWRSLGGRDPEKMDLIHKIQALRKQILNHNVSAMEQERALEETQNLYAALKEFMQKLPSYKEQDKLNQIKAKLNNKDKKLKALLAEFKIKQTDEKTQQIKLDEYKNQLSTTKVQLLQEKKKKQKLLEERQVLVQMQAQCFSAPAHIQRTLGAGFKIIGNF